MKIQIKIDSKDFYDIIIPVAERVRYERPNFYKEVWKLKEYLKSNRTNPKLI